MPKKIPEYLNYFLEDCLGWERSFTKKNMFGGYAIYKHGKVFCLFLRDALYFKVDDNNRGDYEQRNSKPFEYDKKNGTVWVMSYYELPEEILENREELDLWIEKSLAVKSKPKPRKKSEKDMQIDKAIMEALLKIPKWKVSTYKILADQFWVHPRRIASVMKYNKHPDCYPCYKVIAHAWWVGWYSWPDWVNSKVSMLEADWIQIIDWKIDKKYYHNIM